MSEQHSPPASAGARAWQAAFSAGSAESFAEAVTEDVVLEATGLMQPVQGRELVRLVMGVAGEIYDSVSFTHEAARGDRAYLEWEAKAGDYTFLGVTILTQNDAGQPDPLRRDPSPSAGGRPEVRERDDAPPQRTDRGELSLPGGRSDELRIQG